MSRRGPRPIAPILAAHDVPLEERVDGYGKRQREGTGRARRAEGRQAVADEEQGEAGWWRHDGEGTWTYHGDGAKPSKRPVA